MVGVLLLMALLLLMMVAVVLVLEQWGLEVPGMWVVVVGRNSKCKKINKK